MKFTPMKKLSCFLLILFFYKANSQYYYKDIVAATDINRQMKIYSANNIHKVSAIGITPEGTPSTDFSETQELNTAGNNLIIITKADNIISTLQHSFTDAGLLIKTIDSSAKFKSTSTYIYDAAGKIFTINNITTVTDSSWNYSQSEAHQYFYKDGKLDKMWRIINKTDSLEVKFVTDEKGNVIEERNFRKGVFTDPIYYYYDDRNRLTDIVRFNYKANRLLPDYLFEYDDQDRVIQKITTTSNQNLGYLTWRYLYNEKGLKTKEAMFNKNKELQGRIDYTYN